MQVIFYGVAAILAVLLTLKVCGVMENTGVLDIISRLLLCTMFLLGGILQRSNNKTGGIGFFVVAGMYAVLFIMELITFFAF